MGFVMLRTLLEDTVEIASLGLLVTLIGVMAKALIGI
jgi:hypothetical protein